MNRSTRTALVLRGSKVLVTGGTGWLGAHLVQALQRSGAEVCVMTRLPGSASRLWAEQRISVRYGDLMRPPSLRGALRGIDSVFHLASYSPPAGGVDTYQAAQHWSVTAEGTRYLVDAALGAGVRKLVYLSSAKVMGDCAGVPREPADESIPAVPDTLYGRAKLEAERVVLEAGSVGGLHASVLRLPMVYGVGGGGNLNRMIDAVARYRFPPWPRLVNRRSALHVEDAVSATILAATDIRACGEVYFVTDGMAYSTRWMYEQIRLALGRGIPRWAVPFWIWQSVAKIGNVLQRISGRPIPLTSEALLKLAGDAWYSSRKIREQLAFVSQYRLDTELPRMVQAYCIESKQASTGRWAR